MKFDGAMKHFLVAFLIAVVGYFVLFSAIERHRVADGPWQLSFAINAAGNPTIKVDQQRIGIYDVKFCFVSTNQSGAFAPSTMVFEKPRPVPFDVPFGKCIFLDPTVLPGTVTLQVFGHEIELLPKVLIIDLVRRPWIPGEQIDLGPVTNRSAGDFNTRDTAGVRS